MNLYSLQKTPLDSAAALVIHGTCDSVMKSLTEQLSLNVRSFMVKRTVKITVIDNGKFTEKTIKVEAIDQDTSTYSLFSKIFVKFESTTSFAIEKEPFLVY